MHQYMVVDLTENKTLIAGLSEDDATLHMIELSEIFSDREFEVREDRRGA